MSKSVATRDGVYPHTAEEREAILAELQAIIASPQFCNSRRYPALLRYIVENTLAGRSDLLKERTLGIEVFDRPPTYDTNADTVVRFTAGEVRKRLLLYYSKHRRGAGIRISLPTGSYIPEFLKDHGQSEDSGERVRSPEIPAPQHEFIDARAGSTADSEPGARPTTGTQTFSEEDAPASVDKNLAVHKLWLWPAIAALLLLVVIVAGFGLRRREISSVGALHEFWSPIVRDKQPFLICTGGVVFKESNFSGVMTADKNSEYPFVSMQIASAIAQISGLAGRSGATAQLLPAPTTPLSQLREHPIVLLGGYNNQWAMRLLESQRFQFTQEPIESITDRTRPEVHWSRDRAIPYSGSDDYALVSRFRSTTTGNWVVLLAGLGRNGTEAAAEFATNPEHMQALEDLIPGGFGNRNIEVVIKAPVVEGKTGAPSILAVHSW